MTTRRRALRVHFTGTLGHVSEVGGETRPHNAHGALDTNAVYEFAIETRRPDDVLLFWCLVWNVVSEKVIGTLAREEQHAEECVRL